MLVGRTIAKGACVIYQSFVSVDIHVEALPSTLLVPQRCVFLAVLYGRARSNKIHTHD